MLTRKDCEAMLVKQGASKTEARLLIDEMMQLKRDVLAKGGNIQQLSAAWSERAGEIVSANKQAAFNKKLSFLRFSEGIKFLDELKAQGASALEAIQTFLAGKSTYRAGGRQSISALREGIMYSWSGGMLNELEKIPNAMQLLTKDRSFHDAVFVEMREPGTSQDATVRDVANIFSRYMEQARQQANRAGANIGYLEGWTPQNHDPYKIGADGEQWKKDILPLLDTDKSFPGASAQDIDKALDAIRQDILTGKPMFLPSTGDSKGGLASRRFERHRVLHFKDGASALKYHNMYGRGNIFNAMVTHLDHLSRTVALLQKLGPDPWHTLGELVAREEHLLRTNKPNGELKAGKEIEKLRASLKGGSLRNIMMEVTGEVNAPVSQTGAKIMQALRMIQNMAKLGAASLSAIADPFIKASSIRTVSGKNWFESLYESVQQYLTPLDAERREVARKIGSLMDHFRMDVAARWDSDMGSQGKLGLLQQKFFKWSGLDWITERGKAGYGLFLSSEIGHNARHAWADMNADVRAMLQFHGVDEARWNVMRKMVKQYGGHQYFLPELAQNLTDADLIGFLPQKYQGAAPKGQKAREKWERGKQNLLTREREKIQFESMGMFADESRFAIIEPDDATRAIMRQGQHPGTVAGEVLRSVMQFKGFPMAYMQRTLGGRRWVRMSRQAQMRRGWNVGSAIDSVKTDMPGFLGFVLSSIAFGYVAGVAKDLSKGRTPRDPRKKETWLAAIVQSGGAGIFGDYLLGKVSRFGATALETTAGPLALTIGDSILISGELIRGEFGDAGEDLARLAMGNTPFVNLWYTRTAMDWLFMFHVREMLSPGTLRRSEQKMRDDFNQGYWKSPSHNIKRGGGYVPGIGPMNVFMPWTLRD